MFGSLLVASTVLALRATAVTDLSDQALVAEYKSIGLALAGTPDAPSDDPLASYNHLAFAFQTTPFSRVRAEIIKRGKPVVPDLLDLLRSEAVTHRPRDKNGRSVSLAGDTLELLTAIGDPRAVPA